MKTVLITLLICLVSIGNCIAQNSDPAGSATAELEPTREEVKATLALYYEALETEDLSLISFTPDILLGLPDGTTVEGEEDVRLFLANTAEYVVEIEILRTVIEAGYACSRTKYRWKGDKITPLGICFRVIEDQIAEIHPYFDPRPILED